MTCMMLEVAPEGAQSKSVKILSLDMQDIKLLRMATERASGLMFMQPSASEYRSMLRLDRYNLSTAWTTTCEA